MEPFPQAFLNMTSENLALNCLKLKLAHPHSALHPVFHMQIKNFNSFFLETGNLRFSTFRLGSSIIWFFSWSYEIFDINQDFSWASLESDKVILYERSCLKNVFPSMSVATREKKFSKSIKAIRCKADANLWKMLFASLCVWSLWEVFGWLLPPRIYVAAQGNCF